MKPDDRKKPGFGLAEFVCFGLSCLTSYFVITLLWRRLGMADRMDINVMRFAVVLLSLLLYLGFWGFWSAWRRRNTPTD